MLKRRKNLLKFSLRYETDIWGRLIRRNTNNKKIQILIDIIDQYLTKIDKTGTRRKPYQKFIYSIDQYTPRRRRARTSFTREYFVIKRKLQKFYCNIKRHQFRRYAKSKTFVLNYKYRSKINFKSYLNYQKHIFGSINFLSLIEHRLDVLIFRSNFAISMQQSRQLIQHKQVCVNGEIIYSCNYNVKNFDIITLKPKTELRMRRILVQKLKQKTLLCYPPVYLSVDYRLMCALINKIPNYNEIPFPFKTQPHFLMGFGAYY